VALVTEIRDRPAPYYAHTIMRHAALIFDWAIDSGAYGLETSPCDRIKPAKLIGPREPRKRVLNDEEIRAFWNATGKLGYPVGPMLRMLLLTGQRRSEVGKARWTEFDLAAKLWTVPAERFKSNSPHIVPLTEDVISLLRAFPRFRSDYLFSNGRMPAAGFSHAKQRLDRLMPPVPPFTVHDLRRTMRTRLSALRVPDAVAEMVIGHGKKGLARIYDQHRFIDEMREALEAWNARLRAIINPPPANVVEFAGRA